MPTLIYVNRLKENFEPMEDGYLTGRKMYEFYKQNCILQGINVLELTPFNRVSLFLRFLRN